ncbi:NADH-quinone oxidoreductase subunit C [Inquilinus limosus]|uniref:Hydrogenase expression protein HypE n=1 Tax=Inquilinus limosus TaxID=171674 RepID=A0A211ZQ92_9PROT|nr:NADH-quinone oxidoreductase subunit C [Inquilinus limosus]OWJ67419.1 hydrogenase expression protein HypE [Inquilinus limosus]
MQALGDILRTGRAIDGAGGWPRVQVDAATWTAAAERLGEGGLTLLDLWGDRSRGPQVHMALLDEAASEIATATLDCPDESFPSVGWLHPPAIRLERAIRDLFGLEPVGAPDPRPWLDHGRWGVRQPLGSRPPGQGGGAYPFLPVEGESLHQVPVGPVHAGIIEPGHFRFTANGETVVRLEARLGYVHRGLESLMAGATPGHAARLAGRASGDSTVAYACAFAQAVEAGLGVRVPFRAAWLRTLMLELERLANHLGDIGAICNDAAFALMHAHTGVLRERVLRAVGQAFGHRLMMDRVVPGGVAVDPDGRGLEAVAGLVDEIRLRFPPLVELYDNTTSLQDRTVGTGAVTAALARRFGAGGFVGRASGRAFDARRLSGDGPYRMLAFDVPVLQEGDVNARVWIRIHEIEQSLSLIAGILDRLAEGPVRVELPSRAGEGLALVEGFRGDILAWVRFDEDGRVLRGRLRDPSWFQWPLVEAAIEGNIVADFPLCNKSFNCSYAGQDL